MADPTSRFAWDVPNAGSDPWYKQFDGFISGIDTSVFSLESYIGTVNSRVTLVETSAPMRQTLVISYYPGGTLPGSNTLTSTTGLTANWQTLSSAPFGRCVGSFTIAGSGRQALVDLNLDFVIVGGASPAWTVGRVTPYARVVFVTGANTVTCGDSVFYLPSETALMHVQAHWLATASLGAGRYSAEVQMSGVSENTGSPSKFNIDQSGYLWLTITEAVKANS